MHFFIILQTYTYVFSNIKVKSVPESKKFQLHFSNKGTATIYTKRPQDIKVLTNSGSTAPTPHAVIAQPIIENDPWEITRTPEDIQVSQEHDLHEFDGQKNAGVKERDKKGEFIEVDPNVVLRMIQELQRYNHAKQSAPGLIMKELQEKKAKDDLRDKMDKETLERQHKINELKQKILALREKIEEQSAMELTDEIIDEIEQERKQLVKMLNELKGIEDEEDEDDKKPDSFFDQFMEDQSLLLEQLEKKIQDEKKKLEDCIKQIEYMQKEVGTQSEEFKELLKKKFILENLIKDLLQQKIDILKKIKLEKEKQEKLEQIQKEEEEIEQKIKEIAEERKREEEGKEKKDEKNSEQEALDELEEIMNENDATEVEEEQQEKNKEDQAEIEEKQEEVNEIKEDVKDKEKEIQDQEQIVINDEKIIEKDEAQEEMNDGLHEELIEDAEKQKEKLKKINEQMEEQIKQDEALRNKLESRLKSSVPLKHQLDITLNPFYHVLQGVLDKDFSDTSNFDQYSAASLNGQGPAQLKKLSTYLQQVQNYFDHLFGDIPATPEAVPEDTEQRVEEALNIMDQTIKFISEFGVVKEQIRIDLDKSKLILTNLQTDPNDVLQFYDLTDKYFLAMQNAKDNNSEEITELKDKIQDELESFDTQSQDIELKISDLINYEDKLSSVIKKLKSKVPIKDVELKKKDDKREFYKTERLQQLDALMQIIPTLVEIKIDIDKDISECNFTIMELQRNKADIEKLIKDIDIELQKQKLMQHLNNPQDADKNQEELNKLLKSKNSIAMSFSIIVSFFLFQLFLQIINFQIHFLNSKAQIKLTKKLSNFVYCINHLTKNNQLQLKWSKLKPPKDQVKKDPVFQENKEPIYFFQLVELLAILDRVIMLLDILNKLLLPQQQSQSSQQKSYQLFLMMFQEKENQLVLHQNIQEKLQEMMMNFRTFQRSSQTL